MVWDFFRFYFFVFSVVLVLIENIYQTLEKSSKIHRCASHFQLSSRCLEMADFTLEDGQIVSTDKSSETDKSSSVKTGETEIWTNKSSQFVRLFGRLLKRFSRTT